MSKDKEAPTDEEDFSSDEDEFDVEREPRSSVLLPATILAILVALIAGSVIAFILTGTPPPTPADQTPPKMASTTAPPETAANPAEIRKPVEKPAMVEPPNPAPPAEKPAEEAKAPAAEPVPKAEETPAPAKPVEPAPLVAPKQVPSRPPAVAPQIEPKTPDLPKARKSAALSRAPDAALITNTGRGPLPVVGSDGREAWRVYAKPFNQADKRPKIGVVIYGLGTSAAATQAAIQGLPGAVTLAFSPYARNLPDWVAAARAAGHEVLMMVPMEPINYPDFDPGPQALITSASPEQNIDRLNWILSRATGYVGVTDYMGSRFTASSEHMRLFLGALGQRGLLFLESRTGARELSGAIAQQFKVPFAANTLYLDSRAARTAIDGQLQEAERLAKSQGSVIVMGFSYPVTLERVASWAQGVEKRGMVLAPVSAIATRDK